VAIDVYRQGLEYAIANGEVALYRESNDVNAACALAIEQAIQESNHALYRYDLKTASRKVIEEYGAERVVWVLAATLQRLTHDGRFSEDNKNWAKGLVFPRDYTMEGRSSQDIDRNVFYYPVGTHPAILDGFVGVTRIIIAQAEREHGKKIKGPEREERSR